jgi:hypothetical protein
MISITWTTNSIPFENVEIGSLCHIMSLSKVHLKLENNTSKMG